MIVCDPGEEGMCFEAGCGHFIVEEILLLELQSKLN